MVNKKQFLFLIASVSLLLNFTPRTSTAQNLDTSKDRVKTDIKIALPYIGSVKSRSTSEIQGSNWLIGCETLDRDFADYEQYKEYIAPLGIKRLRMQGGWAKTEKVKGVYDWAWLDKIINDATSRGLQLWLQTSYGNKLYPGGGGDNLGAGMMTSKEALDAHYKWVTAMVTRYKDKVIDWEVWNEPNFGDNNMNTPEMTAELNIRTAEIIKKIQPNAKISGLALGHIGLEFSEKFFAYIAQKKKMHLFDNMTYHDYCYNPDGNYLRVYQLRQALDKFAPNMPLRQGENGAPSGSGTGRGALWDYEWSELSQAKWDTRRMLGNLGHDIECSIFGLIEMAYTSGPINRLNYKGIIKSDSTKRVIRPKIAYYAIQNVTSIFDNSLERLKDLEDLHNMTAAKMGENRYAKSTDRSVSVYGFRHKTSKKSLYTLWQDDNIPSDSNATKLQELKFSNADFDTPVFVDIITGGVYEIPAKQWSKTGNIVTFKNIPIYDAPIVIADKSLVLIR
jgi:Beta-galactosidase